MTLLAELKRRNVIRMAGLYLVAAWLVTQVAGTLLPMFEAPTWIARAVVIVLALGFSPALVFAWVFELTPAGLKRDADVPQQQSIAPRTAQRLNRLLVAMLLLAVLYFGVDKFVLGPQRAVAQAAAVSKADALQAAQATSSGNRKSIAVLPFENLSADRDNAYFAAGMQDEILTRLAGIRDLKVISRTSTQQYASRPPNLKVVGQQLGVATVLEGSVQKAGGKVRINLQLIDARTDTHLWAQNYDRDLADVFAVQSDVAGQVADALKAQLLPAESRRLASVPTQNVEAHDLFLQARYLFGRLQTGGAKDPAETARQAGDLYRRAIAVDPRFALAHAWLSYLQSYLHWYAIDTTQATLDDARRNAERALALQPALPEAHLAMGYAHYWGHRDYEDALRELEIARAGLPNDAEVVAAIGYVQRRRGSATFGIPELQLAASLDPQNSLLVREIANSLAMARRYDEADAAFARSLAIFPEDTEAQVQLASVQLVRGDTDSAQRVLAGIPVDVDPEGSVSLVRFRRQMLLRRPDTALVALARAPAWLATRFEHSAVPVDLLRAQALAMKGDAVSARAAFLRAEQALQPRLANPLTHLDASSHLGLVLAGLGLRDAALAAAREASDGLPMSHDPMVGAYTLERRARVEAVVGDADAAIDHLGQLLRAPAGTVIAPPILRIDPAWDALRKDPRFQSLLDEPTGAREPKDRTAEGSPP